MTKNNKNELKKKKVLFAAWGAENINDSLYQNWYLIIKKIVGTLIHFDMGKNYFRFGKEKINFMLLDLIEKVRPDYIFFNFIYDEFYLSTLETIRKKHPEIITVNIFSDDDWRYDNYSRYYSLFIDYALTCHDVVQDYNKDGLNNAIFFMATNCDHFKPLNEKRKYDVVFFGKPNNSRVELIEYLIENNVEVHIWGEGWERYPKFERHYHGYLTADELVKIINKSKIMLGFTIGGFGKPQIKGRPFEVAACKSFILVEHYDKYLDFFKDKKEIIMFKDNKDLLDKIKYYLENDEERERIASKAYKKVFKHHNQSAEIEKFFKLTLKNKKVEKKMPNLNKNYSILDINDLYLEKDKIMEKVGDVDFVSLNRDSEFDQYKHYLQAYALEKSGKDISCCDYYVRSKGIGNYLLFKALVAFNKLNKRDFHKFLRIEQLMFSKHYFIKNLDNIRDFVLKGIGEIINENNTVFISIPLSSTKYLKVDDISYESINKGFQMKFLDKLYSLYYQKRLLTSLYPYLLFIKALFGKKFIFYALKESLNDRKKLEKLRRGF